MTKKKKSDKDNKQNKEDANVHKELKGLDININPFGEIETNFDVEKINQFLNKHVEDKKLKERDEMKKKGLAKESPKPKQSKKSDSKKSSSSSSKKGKKSDSSDDNGDDK